MNQSGKKESQKKVFRLDNINLEESTSIEMYFNIFTFFNRSSSCVKFHKENLAVAKTGVKKLKEGTYLSIIDPSTLEV